MKDVKDLYNDNHKALLKNMGVNKNGNILCLQIKNQYNLFEL